MDLILWRHAEAQELEGKLRDLERVLTRRGNRQASRMAVWLERQLPEGARIFTSPAARAVETAQALGRKFEPRDELLPGATPDALLQLAGWPHTRRPILIVGHQPTLGQTVARLLGMAESECAIKKGALWWLRSRDRDGATQTAVITVQAAELL
jgi:phosphohistidine phosphatase